ncbi:CDP-diacylglycerol--glycerol-3-phosphate 3-phosphatidyltransferase [Clostridium botulinum C]|uniref:CDP-diacylglycerol--glycerol-3-phosphate 3-phosphatidyltransferase n=3 Tax=Clostridium botulinum TaxID=1491 RepID=A0A9Q4XXC3_CLOBO|nr:MULTISPECIES: CDP-diacylglycerol--glycerol-3-phosphate 3-phosphatidyltransferase [Clostridium]EGO87542.1 CDP-diacylglycerol--glycerol-3-phosphate 3-phosphatidyltransferase [Clostridium botulinum C str. Stockholm]AYF54822.1 CDP-diacylglycerol--glycerol-3-phosphate 3-phosphatidyltransferase [Clostridium novyi]EES91826.1 CDP-diacylglycerol--glycerol-3-phosphate 3-phosphatidyltransferase [Clostridium botulinum D str. 1873]KEI10411.1 CDP-diacylglycerol--glycerol-3-phosphate 3-phosphatidyltransfer
MNLANKLTLLRVILVPVFLIFISINSPANTLISIVIFVVAALTDKLDGYIARSRNEITNFGKFMDPLADKLLVTSALVALVQYGVIPAWMVMIIIAREFAVTGLRAVAASEGVVIAASWWGKIKTVIQIIAIILCLISLIYTASYMKYVTYISVSLAVLITLISGIDYFVKNRKVISPSH